MSNGTIIKRRWARWGLIFGFWTLLGLFFASQVYMDYAYTGKPIPWRQALLLALADWYVWAALAPIILWLARRFRIERRRWWRGVLVHLPASLLVTVLKLIIEALLVQSISQIHARRLSGIKLHLTFLTYWAIVGTSYAFDYYRKSQERQLRTAQLETRLAQAQLQVLKMQLHPHFLFNTLHAISTLIHKDPEAADRMIARLSDLLRLTLENAGVQEVPLKQELEFLERYLEIEQIRFQDRLAVKMDIDPEVLDAHLPNLILQPLVENAVRHGIAPREEAGRIEIRARRENEMLCLQVRDDGPGLQEEAPAEFKEGVGLTNTRARLAQLYGSAHRFEMFNAGDGGLAVRLVIPFRTQTGQVLAEER